MNVLEDHDKQLHHYMMIWHLYFFITFGDILWVHSDKLLQNGILDLKLTFIKSYEKFLLQKEVLSFKNNALLYT